MAEAGRGMDDVQGPGHVPRMSRLSRADLSESRRRLAQPMTASAMQTEVGRLNAQLGFWALVQDTPFRDAYVAAQFAEIRGATAVRLGGDPPDFQLSGVWGCDTFEAVETYPRGRRRADEYRRLAEAEDKRLAFGDAALTTAELALFDVTSDPDDNGQWALRASTAIQLLSAATSKKIVKSYPTDWGLVVLLDLGGFIHDDHAVIGQMAEGTAQARHSFAEVWVLWHGIAWLVWRDGKLCMEQANENLLK